MAFKVKIVDISKNADNIILTDNLTIELLKVKYNWILNANVKNCIIGLDDYGIVWYSGEWICGEWEDGTWYSGIWHDGIWKNGRWYSYLIDKTMVITQKFVVLEENETYSEFRSGNWLNGDFYNGIFGYDRDISNKSISDIDNKNFSSAFWYYGNFHKGTFKNSVWLDGVFYNGIMTNTYWFYGKFYNGVFDNYEWHDGLWFGGDFKNGKWFDGKFNQLKYDIKSRFGIGDSCTWYHGDFSSDEYSPINQPEFHSGINIDISGNTLPSIRNDHSIWISGNFYNGIWYGGHFISGIFHHGAWYGGIFGNTIGSEYNYKCIWNNGQWYNGMWVNGFFKNGHFYGGMWIDGILENGYLSTNTIENDINLFSTENIIYPPVVITNSATTTLKYYEMIGKGVVINDGGGKIINRGICWFPSGMTIEPFYGNSFAVTDGSTIGDISITMKNLLNTTTYYYRAFAENLTGITYGNVFSFTTSGQTNKLQTTTLTPQLLPISNSTTFFGMINSSGNTTILDSGFYYTGYTSPDMTYGSVSNVSTSIGVFSNTITNLAPSTLYDYMSYVTDLEGTVTGNTEHIVTLPNSSPIAPTVNTDDIFLIGTDIGIAFGHVIDNGNDTITDEGICWGTSLNPTTANSHTHYLDLQSYFFGHFTDLISGTTYHIRAYATNSVNTAYGKNKTIRTKSSPVVDILSIKNI